MYVAERETVVDDLAEKDCVVGMAGNGCVPANGLAGNGYVSVHELAEGGGDAAGLVERENDADGRSPKARGADAAEASQSSWPASGDGVGLGMAFGGACDASHQLTSYSAKKSSRLCACRGEISRRARTRKHARGGTHVIVRASAIAVHWTLVGLRLPAVAAPANAQIGSSPYPQAMVGGGQWLPRTEEGRHRRPTVVQVVHQLLRENAATRTQCHALVATGCLSG